MSFSTSGTGGGSCSFSINADTLNMNNEIVSQPTIFNTTLNNANQEYTLALPTGTRRFTVKLRSAGLLKISYVTGTSGTNYFSLLPGCTMTENALAPDSNYVLYIQSPQPGAVVELVAWA
jgi:hypothetical protein